MPSDALTGERFEDHPVRLMRDGAVVGFISPETFIAEGEPSELRLSTEPDERLDLGAYRDDGEG